MLAQQAPVGYLSLDQYDKTRTSAQAASSAKFETLAKGVAQDSVKSPVSYDVVRGASLRATLEQWAAMSGWQPLVWKLPEDTDFTLGGSAHFEGDFVTATRSFINSLGAEAELRVHFSQGNRLVVVEPLQ